MARFISGEVVVVPCPFTDLASAQEPAVLDARPTGTGDGQDVVTGQILAQTRGQALVEEDAHQAGASESRSLASSKSATACSRLTVGKSSKNSSRVSPLSR